MVIIYIFPWFGGSKDLQCQIGTSLADLPFLFLTLLAKGQKTCSLDAVSVCKLLLVEGIESSFIVPCN